MYFFFHNLMCFENLLLPLQQSNVSSYPPSAFIARHTRKVTDHCFCFL
nr:MAG TPA: hypothetical protein [Caudoviricetes sp.]DAM35106.1 MAG TPA: hypothetical protein [Caudoviricetes sp.]